MVKKNRIFIAILYVYIYIHILHTFLLERSKTICCKFVQAYILSKLYISQNNYFTLKAMPFLRSCKSHYFLYKYSLYSN